MTPPNVLRRRSAPASAGSGSFGSAPGFSLPSEVLSQICKRIHLVALTFAILWAIPLVLFLLIAPQLPNLPMLAAQLWPLPGAAIAGTGLTFSLVLMVVSPRFSGHPEIQMFLGSAFLVITSLLFGLLVYWVPDFARPQATFIGVAILAYSSIVPNEPGRTLAVGLLSATMAPLAAIFAASS